MDSEASPCIDRLFAHQLMPEGDSVEGCHHLLAQLLQSAREGDLCLPLCSLQPDLLDSVDKLPSSLFSRHLVRTEKALYLRRNWECEQKLILHLQRLCNQIPSKAIELKGADIELLNHEQRQALAKVAAQSLTLITGGPGSGKTFTAALLIRLFMQQHAGSDIAVAAPTGKAAANLRHALCEKAQLCTIKTLHSLLREETIFADLIVVDEGSMIDAALMAQLFAAVSQGARLVVLGDPDQLPPIESGHLFADLAQRKDLVAPLKTCLRAELQEIIDLAQKVRLGLDIPYQPLLPLHTLIQKIIQHKTTVLTPLRRGIYGVDHLNHLLYLEHQRQNAVEIPIILRVNAPSLDLYNGDLGVWNIKDKRILFSGNRAFAEHMVPPYEYGYVLSVHKSQGSEYDNVLILLPQGAEHFGREMLYTAVTRAKKGVEILAEGTILKQILDKKTQRESSFMQG